MDFSYVRTGAFTTAENASPELTDSGDRVFYVLMKGEIEPGDYHKLLRFAESDKDRFLTASFILASPGGDITEAVKIGRLLKDVYAFVEVGRRYGSCASACFIIFASAVDRQSIEGLVGIHRPYVARSRLLRLSLAEAERQQSQALRDAENYLHSLRVPTAIIDEMFANASTDIHWLSWDELQHLGLRPPWWEEELIARCGLNPAQEAEWVNSGGPEESAARAMFDAVTYCQANLALPEAEKNLDAALRRNEVKDRTGKHL
jgi:hypothetical protein